MYFYFYILLNNKIYLKLIYFNSYNLKKMNFSNSRSTFNSFYKNMSKNKYAFNMFNSAFNSKKSMINFSNNYTYSSLIYLRSKMSLVQIGSLIRFSPMMAISENKGTEDLDLNNFLQEYNSKKN